MTSRIGCLLASLVVFGSPLLAQAPTGQSARLRVYLDCGGEFHSGCYEEYLRDEIRFVDFVRQPQDADVHLLSSSNETGGGGREVVLRFVGMGRFAGIDHDLRAVSVTGDTENTRRAIIYRTVLVGLLAYMARDGLPADVDLAVRALEADAGTPRPAERDPWNAWLFSISASADMDAEESSRDRSWDLNFGADRITEAWKMTFGASLDHSTEEFDLDEDDPVKAVRRERDANWFVARSWGPHWSFGFDGRMESSTFGNTKFSLDSAVAVEYSVFPYSEYATRQLRVQYSLGVAHARYNEITLFDRLRETHPAHEMSINLDRREPWGSLDARLQFSQFLHDASKYRLVANGDLNFRITRGLSFNVEGGVSRIHDQLSLPRRGATPEEVLLRLRELQSDYNVSFDVGVTYSFGSLFNNVVNPRFGR